MANCTALAEDGSTAADGFIVGSGGILHRSGLGRHTMITGHRFSGHMTCIRMHGFRQRVILLLFYMCGGAFARFVCALVLSIYDH